MSTELNFETGWSPRTWWNEDDDEAIARLEECETTEWYPVGDNDEDAEEWSNREDVMTGLQRLESFVEDHGEKWCCRRCLYWQSSDGESGDCNDPEMPCGRTRREQLCENFTPYRKP